MSEVTGGGKEHFEVLDGLRGTAALLVVLLHVQEVFFDIPMRSWTLPRAYLAVDFFLLSGFVIGYAYDARWRALTVGRFIRLRLIRLHPLVLLGMVLGFLSFVLVAPHGGWTASTIDAALLALAFSLFLLPNPPFAWHPQATHSLNGPAWSLLQEYIGSLAYALVLRKLSAHALAIIGAACGVLLLSCAIAQNTLNLGFHWHSFWMAPVRLGFPFITGLWLYRVQESWPKVRVNFFLLSLALIIAFAVPNYMLRRWDAFTRFLDDGRICITNNAAERALRCVPLGRKAWLFCGSDRGGQRAAILYTLIQTARLNEVDPQAWLADILARIADHVHMFGEIPPHISVT